MSIHRCTPAVAIDFVQLDPPFSCFNYIENEFGDHACIRRLFSLARSRNARTVVVEKIAAKGIIDDENREILELFTDYSMEGLLRLSFWDQPVLCTDDLEEITSDQLRGYAVLKWDDVPSESYTAWHIFEAVFRKYNHRHNCVPNEHLYDVIVGDNRFHVPGVMYCQQNGLNKACAHVALRSLLSRYASAANTSYRQLNNIARTVHAPGWNPGKGLNAQQIQKILSSFNIQYSDVDYSTKKGNELRDILPYQKLAYAGVESGAGALVGFKFAGPDAQASDQHIIPFYGHTFNKDTWAPDAEINYFRVGDDLRYIPSESWTSSFLGHDDNFGPNFCIPRLYIDRKNVEYVVELFPPGVEYSGVVAEVFALNILYSIIPSINIDDNCWLHRLVDWTANQQIVLRAQPIVKELYLAHLQELHDWNNSSEREELIADFRDELPEVIWVIELSTPHLFPANERKLGEIVMDATRSAANAGELDLFVFARLPGAYIIGATIDEHGTPTFSQIPSQLQTHTALYSHNN